MQRSQPTPDTDAPPTTDRPAQEEHPASIAPPSSRADASTGPLLPKSEPVAGDANYAGTRRMLGTSLGMFLPAAILLAIGIVFIIVIAW